MHGGLRHGRWRIILVVVVAFEELLDAVPAQLRLAFLDRFGILPLLVVHVVGVKVVNIDVWDELRLHGSTGQVIPAKIIKPGV